MNIFFIDLVEFFHMFVDIEFVVLIAHNFLFNVSIFFKLNCFVMNPKRI